MTFSGQVTRAGVKQSELWTDSIIMGGSDPLQSASGFMQASGTELVFSGTTIEIAGSFTAQGNTRAGGYYLPFASIGSPVSKEQTLIQAGSGATGAGSTAWITFPTAYTKVPVVIPVGIGVSDDTEKATIGTIGTGSFQVFTTSASQDFAWIAMGGP